MEKLVLSEIWIYPIKSLGGIRLRSARVLPKGFPHDRRWMLIDEQCVCMTQREYSRMALFKVTFGEDESLRVMYQDDRLTLPLHPVPDNTPIVARVWDDNVSVTEISEEYSRWFSVRLEIVCRLVYFPEENIRAIDPRYRINEDNVSLADAYPFMIIGQKSLADLNQKLEHAVPMNRFRPNLIFTGGNAFGEDYWKNFRIGINRFAAVKKCARCILTTVDQETGARGKEPLTTLAAYRRQDGKVYFGQNLIAIDHEEIHEGDEIILE